ncbi:MAG TPA: VWA domain-containing protein, partial [Candidatus Wallbacteria bacterium]|nr:VWA domain-containing protein [Candidatus Wallbacteria bacterium]
EAVSVIGANSNSYVSVIEFADRPKLLADSEAGRSEIYKIIRGITATDRMPDWRLAMSLAEGMTSEGIAPEIHIFSDFASYGPGNARGTAGLVPFFYHRIGASDKNIGITEFDISPETENGSTGYNIFFTVKNYSGREAAVPVSVEIDGRKMFNSVLTIAPNEVESKVLKKYGSPPSGAVVSIISNDALAADDKRVISANFDSRFKILVMSEKPYFYRTALESIAGTDVDVREPDVPRGIYRGREYDLTVIDDTSETLNIDKYKCVNFAVFDPPEGFMGIKYGQTVSGVGIKTPSVPFEYLHGVDLSDIYIHQMKKAVSTGDFSEIAYGGSGIPVFMRSFNSNSNLFIGLFDPKISNFPLKIAFPVFFNNIVNICRMNSAASENLNIETENYLKIKKFSRMPSDEEVAIAHAEDASGKAAVKVSIPKGVAHIKLPEFNLCGWYKVMQQPDGGKKVPASLYDFFINPPVGRVLSIKPVAPGETREPKAAVKEREFERTHISYSPFLILLAVVIILVDWIYQNNRTFLGKSGSK